MKFIFEYHSGFDSYGDPTSTIGYEVQFPYNIQHDELKQKRRKTVDLLHKSSASIPNLVGDMIAYPAVEVYYLARIGLVLGKAVTAQLYGQPQNYYSDADLATVHDLDAKRQDNSLQTS